MDGRKIWKKTGFGILFVAACFAAMYILMAFYGNIIMVVLAAVVLLVTAFLFLNEVFSDKAKKWVQEGIDEPEAGKGTVSVGTDGEFRLKISKHMKQMESMQEELLDALKNQNMLLQSQMENMEQVIFTLSEKQTNQTKSVIKFNKENARQLAISERETLEYIMTELKQAIENSAGTVGVRTTSEAFAEVPMPEKLAAEVPVEVMIPEEFETEEPVAAPVIEMEEVGEEELFEVSDLPGDDEYEIPDMPAMEEPAMEESVPEPFAGIGGDTNAMMSAEDIANLFAMNAAETPVAEEPAEEAADEFEIPDMPEDIDLAALFEDMAAGALEEAAAEAPAAEDIPVPEETTPAADPLAGLGGDPNAMMTPEDIAKLLASMGQ